MQPKPMESNNIEGESVLQEGGQRSSGDKSVPKKVEENIQKVVKQADKEVTRSSVPWYRVSRRGQILLMVDAVALALFALLAWWVHMHPILAVDVAITREFQENQAPWLHIAMVAVSYIGNNLYLSVGDVVVAAVFFWLVRLRLEALFVVGVSVTTGLLNLAIKVIVARPRPTTKLVEVLQYAGGQSFPSGHVMAYMAYFGLLFSLGLILLKRDRWWHYLILIIPAAFVALVGPSRIYLGDHWASDVLGGYVIAGVWLGLSLWLYLRLRAKGVLARSKSEKE